MAKTKKLANEAELLKEGIRLGMEYGEKRGVVEFEATDSANEKIEYVYKGVNLPPYSVKAITSLRRLKLGKVRSWQPSVTILMNFTSFGSNR